MIFGKSFFSENICGLILHNHFCFINSLTLIGLYKSPNISLCSLIIFLLGEADVKHLYLIYSLSFNKKFDNSSDFPSTPQCASSNHINIFLILNSFIFSIILDDD